MTFVCFLFFFFNDTATTEIYTLSLHDALPILGDWVIVSLAGEDGRMRDVGSWHRDPALRTTVARYAELRLASIQPDAPRSEEHTSELQSRQYLVCRLLLEKKKKNKNSYTSHLR